MPRKTKKSQKASEKCPFCGGCVDLDLRIFQLHIAHDCPDAPEEIKAARKKQNLSGRCPHCEGGVKDLPFHITAKCRAKKSVQLRAKLTLKRLAAIKAAKNPFILNQRRLTWAKTRPPANQGRPDGEKESDGDYYRRGRRLPGNYGSKG